MPKEKSRHVTSTLANKGVLFRLEVFSLQLNNGKSAMSASITAITSEYR